MDRRSAVPMTVLAALLVAFASPAAAAVPDWSFRAYANDVRVVPPLVGDWQLGKSRIHGRGIGFDGSITDTWEPARSKYSPARMRAHVTGYKHQVGPHGRWVKLVLSIVIDSTDSPGCAAGDTGKLRLLDSKATLDNGHPADAVSMWWANGRCPGFVQGWTNEDGGAKTRPSRGGPPDGGSWAVVRID